MFRVSQHPSSGVLKTVTAASGTGHNIGTVTSFQRDHIWPRWTEVAALEAAAFSTGHNIGTATSFQSGHIWPRWTEVAVPEAAVTVFSTPDDGYCDTRNM